MVSVFSTRAREPWWWIRTLHQSRNRRKGTDRVGVSPGSVRLRGRTRLWTRRGLGRTDPPREVRRHRAFLFPRSPEEGLRKLMNFNKPPSHPSPPSPARPCTHRSAPSARVRSAVNTTLCVSVGTSRVPSPSQRNSNDGRRTRARAPVTE